MPKVNKISGSKPGMAAPVKEQPAKFRCTRCPREFTKQKGNFPASQSPIFHENGGYMPICKHCIDEMYEHYKAALGSEKAAIRRICLKFDVYWNEEIYNMLCKTSTTASRVLSYISKSNLYKYIGKTYDDTLDEEAAAIEEGEAGIEYSMYANDTGDIGEDGNTPLAPEVDKSVVEFWGAGFTASFYDELERRFKHWCGDADRNTMDVSDCAVIRQICMLEVTIAKDTAAGKATDKAVNALNTLLGSANLKPAQKRKEESLDAATESTPFGMWIRKIEDTRPIPEPDESLKDVDGIARYISVWFLGHLCKMLKIENTYSRAYDEEMSRLRVERPEYEGEDDDAMLEDIFERAASSKEDGDEYVE